MTEPVEPSLDELRWNTRRTVAPKETNCWYTISAPHVWNAANAFSVVLVIENILDRDQSRSSNDYPKTLGEYRPRSMFAQVVSHLGHWRTYVLSKEVQFATVPSYIKAESLNQLPHPAVY